MQIKVSDVAAWAHRSRPGERVIYHTVAVDAPTRIGPAVKDAALCRAYLAHTLGMVFLAQRKVGKEWWYEATRVSDTTARKLGIGPYAATSLSYVHVDPRRPHIASQPDRDNDYASSWRWGS